jgi:VanZ family protein
VHIYLMQKFNQTMFGVALVTFTVLALLPSEMLTAPVFNWWDKAQHAAAFAVLTALGFAAFAHRPWRVVVGLVCFGAAIELAQLAVGWRFGEWQDLLADMVGVLAVGVARTLWQQRRAPF